MKLLNDGVYLDIAREDYDLDSEAGLRKALSRARFIDKTVVDPDYDQRWHIGPNGYGPEGTGADGKPISSSSSTPESFVPVPELAEVFKAFAAAHNGQTSMDPAQLKPYIETPEQEVAWQKIMQMKPH